MDQNLKEDGTPLVTILMPVHNGETYIKHSIESVLSQEFTDFELLIIDDDSTDETVKIVNAYKDVRIRLIHNPKRLGLAETRQRGVTVSLGKFIAFLDCDDISLPDRLKKQIEFLDKNKEIYLVGSWVKVIDETGKITGRIWRHTSSPDIIPVILLFRNCFTQSAVLVKKDCLLRFPFRNEFWAAPDYDLWTRLATHYKLANIGEVLTYYRTYKKSMSFRKREEIKRCTQKIVLNNLRRLGITPTEEEIAIHDSLERNQGEYSNEMIDKIQVWLAKLIAANEKSCLYPVDIFSTVVVNYWFRICCASAKRGDSIWKKYCHPFLPEFKQSHWIKNLILFTLCTLRKSRIIDITSDPWIRIAY